MTAARLLWVLALLLAALGAARPGTAHEVRPSFLHLVEVEPGSFDVLWKTPMRGDARLALAPVFPGSVEAVTPVLTRRVDGAAVQTWRLRATDLRGRTIRIAGLERTMTDALIQVDFADGSRWFARVDGVSPEAAIPPLPAPWELAASFTRLGIDHILLGVDHLLFVLGLMLITVGGWRMVKTVTAFTLAHSVTLALATFGVVAVPLAPLNAAIALSILFLGPEILRVWRGETSLTIRHPWIVSFGFGLLHGFGFASGLTVEGMAQGAIPQALLWFDVGVEIGQLGFILLAGGLMLAFRRLEVATPVWVARAPGYAVGALGAYWAIERSAAMVAGRIL